MVFFRIFNYVSFSIFSKCCSIFVLVGNVWFRIRVDVHTRHDVVFMLNVDVNQIQFTRVTVSFYKYIMFCVSISVFCLILSLPYPNMNIINNLQNMFHSYLWGGGPDKVKRVTVVQGYEQGGLDINTFIVALTITWLRRCFMYNISDSN